MKKRLREVLIGTGMAAALAIPAASAQAEEYPELKLRMAHFVPAQLTGSKVDQWWADEINKRSGGKIKIEIFWAESLGKAKEILDLVSSGAVDLGATAQGYFPAELPLVGATNSVMLGFENHDEATRTTAEMVESLASMKAELKRNNVYPIFFHSLGGYRPFCTSPIETLADFRGKKMRSWGEYVPILWQSVGATGVNVLTNEIYEALQRGTVDCAFWSHDSANDVKLHEVAKYAWSHHLGAIPTWPVWVSWENWHGGWPESVKKLMTEVGMEAMERDIRLTGENNKKALKTMVEEHGVKVVQFKEWDKLVATMPDMLQIWLDNMEKRRLGKEAKEVAAFWQERATPLKDWDFSDGQP